MATTVRAFAAPADLSPAVRAEAEALWASTLATAPQPLSIEECAAVDDRLAVLLGLGPGDGHDELTRCEAPGCDAWHYADEGATVVYESGTSLDVCAAHAQRDDPGARVCPGVGLDAAWRAAEQAEISARIRATGSSW